MRAYRVALRDCMTRKRHNYELRACNAPEAVCRAREEHTAAFQRRRPELGISSRRTELIDVKAVR